MRYYVLHEVLSTWHITFRFHFFDQVVKTSVFYLRQRLIIKNYHLAYGNTYLSWSWIFQWLINNKTVFYILIFYITIVLIILSPIFFNWIVFYIISLSNKNSCCYSYRLSRCDFLICPNSLLRWKKWMLFLIKLLRKITIKLVFNLFNYTTGFSRLPFSCQLKAIDLYLMWLKCLDFI